jgi:hypothetical protein
MQACRLAASVALTTGSERAGSGAADGGSIFGLHSQLRYGNYSRYTRGDIQVYSDSYFRADGKKGASSITATDN